MEIIAQVRYDKLAEIGDGEGRNSHVFRAFDHHLHAELVVKEVDKKAIKDPARYFLEARAFYASEHPRVVPVRWAAQTTDHVCIAMPLMQGGSLAKMLKGGLLRPSRLIEVAQDICEGVAQVHLAKFVHLDIKPTNILFDANGRACVTDFGQALLLDGIGTADASRHLLYTKCTPPEARTTGVVTPASDVYQIGLTLYRALIGERQFAVEQMAGPLAFGTDLSFLPFVPLGIRQAIRRALDQDPAKRQVGARALAEDLVNVEIKHDWMTERDDDDVTVWRLRHDGRADTVITREGIFPAVRVEAWTESTAGRRRKAPEAWAKGIRTRRQLNTALSRAFRAATA